MTATQTATKINNISASHVSRVLNAAGYQKGDMNRRTERVNVSGFFAHLETYTRRYVHVSYEFTGWKLTDEQITNINEITGDMATELRAAGFNVEIKTAWNSQTIYLEVTK